MSVIDPLACERCSRRLESDDAISVIEGVCGICRNTASSLVQPVRADQILGDGRASDETDDFLSDLPRIESWSPRPIPAEPWLVEESSDPYGEGAPGSLFDGIHAEPSETQRAQSRIEGTVPSKHAADGPLIPPGPFSPENRALAKPKRDPVENVSEIFSTGSIPPSDLPAMDSDDSDDRSRVDIHRFNPPPAPFSKSAPPRRRRRKRALTFGVFLGVVLTGIGAWLATDKDMRNRVMAWVDEHRKFDMAVADDTTEFVLRVEPAEAIVRLDGVDMGPADESGRIRLSVDRSNMTDRLLEVSSHGYQPLTQSLGDFRGMDEASVQLVRAPFEAEIASDPTGAEVWLDGQLVGATPVTTTVTPDAGAWVVLRKEGFRPVERTLEMPVNDDILRLRVPLEPAGITLSVKTDPVPAQIFINDRLFGAAPQDIDLDYQFLNRTVEVVARAKGYDDARMSISMPSVGGDTMAASLKLERTMARLNVRTEPPGGRVVVAGRDFGYAPVLVEFEPTETGKSVVIDTSRDGKFFGRQSVKIPPSGAPRECTIPMAFSAQRVVFIMAASRAAKADQYLLADAMGSQIERLEATQRFAVVAASDDGIEAWPYEVAFESATNEQKVRAFDMVRSIRPAEHVELESLLSAAVQLDPTTVWLFAESADKSALDSFAKELDGRNVSINLIVSRTAQSDTWLDGFTARNGGVFKLLDEFTPAVAMDESAE